MKAFFVGTKIMFLRPGEGGWELTIRYTSTGKIKEIKTLISPTVETPHSIQITEPNNNNNEMLHFFCDVFIL